MRIGRTALIVAAAGTAALAFVFAGEAPLPVQTLEVPGAPFEIQCRSLQPGEPILVRLKADAPAGPIRVRLGQEAIVLSKPVADDPGRSFALLGIDLGTKPGPLEIVVEVENPDRTIAATLFVLQVAARDFPTREFRIATSMVTPPSEQTERIRRESEMVAAILAVVSPEWLAKGSFQSPLPDFEPFPNFGQRRVYNKKVGSVHSGVDISAPRDTPALAPNDGRIVLASKLYFSGNTVIIDHGLGVFTHGCHFDELLVRRGDMVAKGQAVAKVGSTGRSTGPHLHWSVRILGARIDPYALLSLPLRES